MMNSVRSTVIADWTKNAVRFDIGFADSNALSDMIGLARVDAPAGMTEDSVSVTTESRQIACQ